MSEEESISEETTKTRGFPEGGWGQNIVSVQRSEACCSCKLMLRKEKKYEYID